MGIDITKYTREWFQSASLADLNNHREIVRRESLIKSLTMSDKITCHDLLFKFDDYIRTKSA